jgi:pimeloyl-ACP methyl ester carboxylesterase
VRLDIDGTSLEYEELGSGQPVVLVHGSASDHRTWQGRHETLAGRFRVIRYSRRYHWPNDPIPDGADYSMNQHVADLAAVVRSLDAAPAHLVGHSYGGFLCLLLAIREPSLVRSLVLGEPPVVTLFVSPVPKPQEMLRLLVTRPRTAAAVFRFGAMGVAPASKAFREGDRERGLRAFAGAVFGPGGFDRMPEARKARVRDNLPNVQAELLGSGLVPLDTEDVRGVRVPTLLITGGRSIALFHRLTDRLEELLPSARRFDVPDASHAMHEDNADAYDGALLSFLNEHGTTAE